MNMYICIYIYMYQVLRGGFSSESTGLRVLSKGNCQIEREGGGVSCDLRSSLGLVDHCDASSSRIFGFWDGIPPHS